MPHKTSGEGWVGLSTVRSQYNMAKLTVKFSPRRQYTGSFSLILILLSQLPRYIHYRGITGRAITRPQKYAIRRTLKGSNCYIKYKKSFAYKRTPQAVIWSVDLWHLVKEFERPCPGMTCHISPTTRFRITDMVINCFISFTAGYFMLYTYIIFACNVSICWTASTQLVPCGNLSHTTRNM